MEQNIENLLYQVAAINKKYENIAEITGENFNIFRIMRMESDEVKTHSRLIGELLNPGGSHGQKSIFLKLFIETFKLNINLDEAILNSGEVKLEEWVNEGRIDIVIKFKNKQVIVIENKIHAIDQDGQLARYKYCYRNCDLVYLTLYGREPSKESLIYEDVNLGVSKDYVTKSYQKDILQWLELSKAAANNHPHLKETLSQYIFTIKNLTNQTMSHQQINETIREIIISPEKIQAAKYTADIWPEIKITIMEELKTHLKKIAEELGVEIEINKGYNKQFGTEDTGFWFFRKGWKYCIYFYWSNDYENMLLGIDVCDTKDSLTKNKSLTFFLEEILGGKTIEEFSKDWLWVKHYDYWNSCDFEDYLTNSKDNIKEEVREMIEKLDSELKTNEEFKTNWFK